MRLTGNHYVAAPETWVPGHGYVLKLKADRFEELQNDLSVEGICSQAISELPQAMRRRRMLCFISVRRGYLTHVARSVFLYVAESGKDRLDIWKMLELPNPVRISEIRAKLIGRQAWRASSALDGGHISSSAFDLVMTALSNVDAKSFDVAKSLINDKTVGPDPTPTTAKMNWAYQRDAVITALEIAGIPKDQADVPAQLDSDSPSELTSIFDSEDSVTTIEDLVILQDLDSADVDWKFVKRQRYPAKTFTFNSTTLTIILANKLPLERQLGVDLVYVNETLNSVVFVQYKMFAGEDGENGYRPDSQLRAEICRMDETGSALSSVPDDETCDGYRIGSDPFFLKFCRKLLTYDDKGHVPGIYVPLSFWKRLVATPAVVGPRGGTVIYPETFGRRYLTPTQFIDLVGRGWIGTSALQTRALAPYLRAAVHGKKAVVLAVQSKALPDEDNAGCEEMPEDESKFVRTVKRRKSRYPGRKPRQVQI